jgi:hypothetical protein
MTPLAVVIDTPNQKGVKEGLQWLTDLVNAGKVRGFSIVIERSDDMFEYSRFEMSILTAIALHQRAIHKLNESW